MIEFKQQVAEALEGAIDDGQRALFAGGGRVIVAGFSKALAWELAPRVAAAIEAAVAWPLKRAADVADMPETGKSIAAALAALRGEK